MELRGFRFGWFWASAEGMLPMGKQSKGTA
jgi:hypothetical protein